MTATADALREQLRRIADDCEQRASLALDSEARGQYNTIAAKARSFARDPGLGEDGLRLALDSIKGQARFAAWHAGDTLPEPLTAPVEGFGLAGRAHGGPDYANASSESPVPPEESLNTSQLAERFSIGARGARKAIEAAYNRGEPGFYCEPNGARRRWYALPDAFAKRRRVP